MLDSMRGVKKYICTLSDERLVLEVLKRNKILKYFDGIVSASQYNMDKCSCDLFELTLEKMGTPKEFTFVFEDSSYALETAKKAGFITIGVYDKHSDNNNIENFCDYFTKEFEEWK